MLDTALSSFVGMHPVPLVHGMTIVTRNTVDFESTGAAVLNPWIRRAP